MSAKLLLLNYLTTLGHNKNVYITSLWKWFALLTVLTVFYKNRWLLGRKLPSAGFLYWHKWYGLSFSSVPKKFAFAKVGCAKYNPSWFLTWSSQLGHKLGFPGGNRESSGEEKEKCWLQSERGAFKKVPTSKRRKCFSHALSSFPLFLSFLFFFCCCCFDFFIV